MQTKAKRATENTAFVLKNCTIKFFKHSVAHSRV